MAPAPSLFLRLALAATLAAALAGCADPGVFRDATEDTETAAPATTDGDAPAAVELPPLPSDKPLPPSMRLVDLVGSDSGEIVALLGPPLEEQDRAPASVWVYDGIDCRFSLLLYPELESERWTVLAFESEDGEACAVRIARP